MPENACFGSTNRHIHTSKTQWVSILFNQLRGFSARTNEALITGQASRDIAESELRTMKLIHIPTGL
ncbi:putative NAD-dependent epimerase/dehydratase [Roseibium sp. TrichSKD4]|nr:putative NAD-dependent epimerase/dehydratase [Roseibium sp. TrichSKD4]